MKLKNVVVGILFLLGACRPEPTVRGNTYFLRGSPLEISLSFDAHENRYFGKVVNRYYGTYQMDENTISFSSPSSTMYSGDEDDLVLEETYLSDLSTAKTYRLDENTLTLHLTNHKELVFDLR